MALSDEQVKTLKGLTKAQAEKALKEGGPNELPSAKKRGALAIVFDVFKEPMFLLLVAIGVIYLFPGDIQEAIMLLGFVFVIMGITIYQEGKTERTLEALRDLSSPRALVIRDGQRIRIPGREVVRADHIVLSEGDRVPADAVLVWGVNLSVDESLLTGESVAVVKATGPRSEIGKIGKAIQTVPQSETTLQRETRSIVKTIFLFAMVLFAVVVVVYGMTRGDWLNGLLSGLTLAMATLPEEFPVVLTIFLALGAWRMSQKWALARKMAAVETLGAATVLCVDKTGTLTQNRMKIRKLFAGGLFHEVTAGPSNSLPESFHELLEFGILASQVDPFDPMEKAIREVGASALTDTEHLHGNWTLVQQYPLSRELLALSHVWKSTAAELYVVATKGAPEAIAECREAGIKVVMITGDYPGTAQNIAAQIGLPDAGNIITDPELEEMSPRELGARIAEVGIFARVVPEQKLRIVDALKERGGVVAMTGDGVNDAPALKSAHIGVAMGGRGTDVAREASDLVLLDGAGLVSVVWFEIAKLVTRGRRPL